MKKLYWREPAVIVLLACPWLWPFSLGPYAEAMPWLFSLGVAGILLALWPAGDVTRLLAIAWSSTACISVIPELLQYFGIYFFHPWVRDAAPGYAIGNIGQPNQQATFLGMGVLALCWLLRNGGRQQLIWIMGGLIAVGMAATASRIGFVHMVTIFVLIMCWGNKDRKKLIQWYIFVSVIYVVISIVLPIIAAQIGIENARSLWFRLQSGESSCSSRLYLWSNVVELISAKPWLGWGWDNLRYAQYMTLFQGERWCEVLGNAHNLPLHLAVTLGIPAASFLCVLGVTLIIREAPWREADSRRQFAWGILIVIIMHSLVEFPIWYGPFQIAVILCVLILMRTKGDSGWIEGNSRLFKKFLRYGCAGTLLAVSIFVMSDYWRASQPYITPEQRVKYINKLDGQELLNYSSKTIFFQNHALFARIISINADKENAIFVNRLAIHLLHFSPEPRVLERLMDSAFLLNDMEQIKFHALRFKIAYPKEYQAWLSSRFPSGNHGLLGDS